jgi:hypothetical protein
MTDSFPVLGFASVSLVGHANTRIQGINAMRRRVLGMLSAPELVMAQTHDPAVNGTRHRARITLSATPMRIHRRGRRFSAP